MVFVPSDFRNNQLETVEQYVFIKYKDISINVLKPT